MHSRRHTTRLPSYRHKTFPTQISLELLIILALQYQAGFDRLTLLVLHWLF